ncbi:MAG: CvpA family protein [Elusimicrobiota bacterium]
MKFDLVLAGVVALFGLFGLLSGAINQLRRWIGVLLAALAARPLAVRLAPLAAPKTRFPPKAVEVALSGLLFVVLYFIGSAAARRLLAKLFPDRQNGRGDRAVGFGLGAAKGAFLVFALLSVLIFFEKPLTETYGPPPAPFLESRAVAFVRLHDLFDAVPIPALAKLQQLAQAAKNPNGGLQSLENQPELKKLLDDPQLKAALQNPEITQALKSGDFSALQNDPRFRALLNDPRLKALTAGSTP